MTSAERFAKYDVPIPRYTSYPTVPQWHQPPAPEDWTASLRRAATQPDAALAVYVHVPFCESLCTFCGCNTIITRDHGRVQSYFNLDNGGGSIRGVYAQGNNAIVPIFRKWMEPLRDLGMTHVSTRSTGGTDHLSFDAAGLPGFQFIQDPLEYESRTHHSSMDVYDRVQEDDMKQASIIMASFVYHAAMRDEKLPRKPLVGEIVDAVPQQ